MINYYDTHAGQGIPNFDSSLLARLKAGNDYVVSSGLERAVNLALFLGQPLLLTGEPGTGKTELARHLAQRFSQNGIVEDYYIFNTKTTSSYKDLFYWYDSLGHFQYIQNHKGGELSTKIIEDKFIHYQALGKAIQSGKRCVVLIDEIDKAPRDLPNDILDVMEQLSFEVPELNYTGNNRIGTSPEHRPLVILTSNSEKNLPDAFLRRCIFYHIPFPDDQLLLKILNKKCNQFNEEELGYLIDHFKKIRNACKRKKPSTAELLQWVSVLEKQVADKKIRIKGFKEGFSTQEKLELNGSYSLLVKDKDDLKAVLEL